MRYLDGSKAEVGDTVLLESGQNGTVVFSADDGHYSDEYPESEWSYLDSGIMVRTDDGNLIHYPEECDELTRLVARSQ